MFTKKETAAFNKKVEETLIGYSATKTDMNSLGFPYQLPTDAGILEVSCLEPDKSNVLSIYLCFLDYDKALSVLGKIELGMNAKWNIHTRLGIDQAISYLNYKLSLVNAVNYIPCQTQ